MRYCASRGPHRVPAVAVGKKSNKPKKKGWRKQRSTCAVCDAQIRQCAARLAGRAICFDCIKLPFGLAIDAMRELAVIEGRFDVPEGDPWEN